MIGQDKWVSEMNFDVMANQANSRLYTPAISKARQEPSQGKDVLYTCGEAKSPTHKSSKLIIDKIRISVN